jgi:tellurite resistance protein TerC
MPPAEALVAPQTPAWAWLVFAAIIVAALGADLLIVDRRAHAQNLREAVLWSVAWVGLGVAFGVFTYFVLGHSSGLEYITAFLVEKSLSVDNLFIFIVIFNFFGVRPEFQHRTLFWGILGAIIMRGIMIFAGVALLREFEWLVFVFGAILIISGVKLLLSRQEAYDPSHSLVYRVVRRYVPLTPAYDGHRFFTRCEGRLLATPLFLVLVVIEGTDLVFAVDSIPACLAISRDPFIVYSSNIFAILGLRALYFVMAGAMRSLRFLKPALSVVLVFIGIKMVIAGFAHGRYKIPTGVSLAVVAAILGVAVAASLLFPAPAPHSATASEGQTPDPDGAAEKR